MAEAKELVAWSSKKFEEAVMNTVNEEQWFLELDA